jgi:PAS domain S-box-containing protein
MSRILIVDDRDEGRYLLHRLLQGNGYEVEVACHGRGALTRARERPPQLVISDLLMPVMDGYSLLRQWKADEVLKDIPFVVYTATYTDPKDETLALSLGANAFILKPAEPDIFLARIREVLANATSTGAEPTALTEPGGPTRLPIAAPDEEEARNLRQYSEVLIHKLEDKMEEAERANRELQQELAERKRIEAQLREREESHARLATAVEQAAESIVITDLSGTILYVNPAFERITGYTAQEAVGRNPRMLKSGQHDAAFYGQMWDTLLQGHVWSGRITNKKKSGALYEAEITISPIHDSTGQIVNYVAVKHDVTRQVLMESQLRQAQKMEAIGQLAGGVAHDFNNLLTVIQGNASLLLSAEVNSAIRTECSQQILHATERAATLTRQLLLFSRKQVMQPANRNLNDIVEGMVKMLRRVLGGDVALRSELAPGLPPVFADVGMIEQILLNLAVNARDAMPTGGVLTISTGTQVLDGKEATNAHLDAAGEFVWLRISDTGCGIPPEVRPRIFEPFFTTKEVGKGTGLGLATVYGIVEQHHGWIDVTSETGSGSTFKVYLPAANGRQAARKALAIPESPAT